MLVVAVSGRGLVAPDAPVATADDLGLTRGDGCFEGLRLVRDPASPAGAVVQDVEAHLARMARSAAALELPADEASWRELLDLVAAEWATAHPGATEAAVKLSLTRGRPGAPERPTAIATVTATGADVLAARRDGIRVATMTRGYPADAFAGAPWLLGGVKTLSYAVHTAAQREAVRRGADDALFTAADGSLLEAPTAAVVWAVGRELRTVAPGANGILASTTQRALFARAADAGWSTHEGTGTPADLRAADAVVLTSAVRGPVAVVELDGERLRPDPRVVVELQRLAGF